MILLSIALLGIAIWNLVVGMWIVALVCGILAFAIAAEWYFWYVDGV